MLAVLLQSRRASEVGWGGGGWGCRLGFSAESADAWKLLSETLCHARTSKQAAAAEGCTSAATLATLETLHRIWQWTHTRMHSPPQPPLPNKGSAPLQLHSININKKCDD